MALVRLHRAQARPKRSPAVGEAYADFVHRYREQFPSAGSIPARILSGNIDWDSARTRREYGWRPLMLDDETAMLASDNIVAPVQKRQPEAQPDPLVVPDIAGSELQQRPRARQPLGEDDDSDPLPSAQAGSPPSFPPPRLPVDEYHDESVSRVESGSESNESDDDLPAAEPSSDVETDLEEEVIRAPHSPPSKKKAVSVQRIDEAWVKAGLLKLVGKGKRRKRLKTDVTNKVVQESVKGALRPVFATNFTARFTASGCQSVHQFRQKIEKLLNKACWYCEEEQIGSNSRNRVEKIREADRRVRDSGAWQWNPGVGGYMNTASEQEMYDNAHAVRPRKSIGVGNYISDTPYVQSELGNYGQLKSQGVLPEKDIRGWPKLDSQVVSSWPRLDNYADMTMQRYQDQLSLMDVEERRDRDERVGTPTDIEDDAVLKHPGGIDGTNPFDVRATPAPTTKASPPLKSSKKCMQLCQITSLDVSCKRRSDERFISIIGLAEPVEGHRFRRACNDTCMEEWELLLQYGAAVRLRTALQSVDTAIHTKAGISRPIIPSIKVRETTRCANKFELRYRLCYPAGTWAQRVVVDLEHTNLGIVILCIVGCLLLFLLLSAVCYYKILQIPRVAAAVNGWLRRRKLQWRVADGVERTESGHYIKPGMVSTGAHGKKSREEIRRTVNKWRKQRLAEGRVDGAPRSLFSTVQLVRTQKHEREQADDTAEEVYSDLLETE